MSSALICCAPRSGAAWLTEFLRRLSVPATHEVLFRPELPRPQTIPPEWVETSWLSTPFTAFTEADVKFHLVRNPLHVVRSMMRIELFARPFDPFVHFARTYTDCWQDRDPLANTCAMLVEWHRLAAGLPVVRLEDLRQYPATYASAFLNDLGYSKDQRLIHEVLGEMPDRLNQRGDSSTDTIGWLDVRPEIRRIAERLGYL